MSWNLKADRPIYTQIVEYIQTKIVSGLYKAGDKLPSVREMAAEAAVNPNTMQKAFTELERLGLVYTQRTSGRFITEDQKMIDDVRNQLAEEKITEFFEIMKQLGFKEEDTVELIKNVSRERES